MSSSVMKTGLNEGDLHQRLAARLKRLGNQTDIERIYNEAVQRVLRKYNNNNISDDLLDRLVATNSADELLQDVEAAKVKHQEPKRFRLLSEITASAQWSLEQFERFGKCVDVMVQSRPEVASLVWGSVRVLLVIARDIFDTYERLIQLGNKINNCLERFTEYLQIFSPGSLLSARLVDFYEIVIDFCLQAIVARNRSGIRTFGKALWESLKQPFDRLLDGLTENAEEVDKAAQTQHMREAKKDRESARNADPNGQAPSPSSFCVPKLLSKHFTGRQDTLDRLRGALPQPFDHPQPRLVAIWGVPGVGKTQMLHKYAQETKKLYERVFFIRADGPTQILDDYRVIAQELCVRDTDGDLQERVLIEKVKKALNKSRNWLLLFDNVQQTGDVAPYLPDTGTGDIIFSMRNKVTCLALADEQFVFEVQPLQMAATVDLTCSLLRVTSPDPALIAIAQKLHDLVAGLPIAVEQAAVLSELSQQRLKSVVEKLEKQRSEILNEPYPTSSHETKSPTGVLLKMALARLTKDYPQAAALLNVLIYLDTSSIPLDMLREGSAQLSSFFNRTQTFDRGVLRSQREEERRANGEIRPNLDPDLRSPWEIFKESKIYHKLPSALRRERAPELAQSAYDRLLTDRFVKDAHLRRVLEDHNLLNNAITQLEASGLLKKNNVKTVSIHDLIRDIYIELLQAEQARAYQVNALCAMTLIFLAFPVPERLRLKYQLCSSYLPHALSALRHSEGFSIDTVVGPELMHLAASTIDLNNRWWGLDITPQNDPVKWYGKAVRGYIRAMKTLELIKSRLSTVLEARRKFNLELRGACYDRIVTGYERFGQAPERIFHTAVKIGYLHYERNNWAQAEIFADKAFQGYRAMFGEHHEMTHGAMSLRINIARWSNDWEKALELGFEKLSMLEERLVETTDGATCAGSISLALEHLHRYDEALWWRCKAGTRLLAFYGFGKPLGSSLATCARLNRKVGDHREANRYCLLIPLVDKEDDLGSCVNDARLGVAISKEALGQADNLKVENLWQRLLDKTADVSAEAIADETHPSGFIRLQIVWNVCRYWSATGKDLPSSLEPDTIALAEARYGSFTGWSFQDDPNLILPTDLDIPRLAF